MKTAAGAVDPHRRRVPRAYCIFGQDRFLFVASERTSLIFVYDAADPLNPIFKQALPAAMAPEGVLAIPSRKLLVVASQMRG